MNKLISLLAVLALAAPSFAGIIDWQDSTVPAFYALDVTPGAYDIGELSGAITYEFIVNSNPEETQASMALIGNMVGENGPARSAIKYEQWNNSGTYGITLFGIADYDSGMATAPGADTHLVFVSDAGETDLYVNGVYQTSLPAEITLSGMVGIGMAIKDAAGTEFVDRFDGDILGVAIYNTALAPSVIQAKADAFFIPEPASIVLLGLGMTGLLVRRRR